MIFKRDKSPLLRLETKSLLGSMNKIEKTGFIPSKNGNKREQEMILNPYETNEHLMSKDTTSN